MYSGNPSIETTPFSPEIWPLKMGDLSSVVEINTFMFYMNEDIFLYICVYVLFKVTH